MLSSLINPLIELLHQLAGVVPLPVFTFVGALIEEIVAPIPSPIVMTLAGSMAASLGSPWTYLGWLALIGAIGKTIGSYVIYLVADKGEDLIMTKFGKYIGITHREVESISKHLNHGWRDEVVIFLLRAIPIMPTAPVSIVCGMIKVRLTTYLSATFFGTLVRNIFYLYLGYTSVGALESLNEGIDSMEKFGYIILLGLIALLFGYIYYQKKNNAGIDFLEKKAKKTNN